MHAIVWVSAEMPARRRCRRVGMAQVLEISITLPSSSSNHIRRPAFHRDYVLLIPQEQTESVALLSHIHRYPSWIGPSEIVPIRHHLAASILDVQYRTHNRAWWN